MDLLQIDEFALRSLGTRVSGDFVKKVEFVQRTQQEDDEEEEEGGKFKGKYFKPGLCAPFISLRPMLHPPPHSPTPHSLTQRECSST